MAMNEDYRLQCVRCGKIQRTAGDECEECGCPVLRQVKEY